MRRRGMTGLKNMSIRELNTTLAPEHYGRITGALYVILRTVHLAAVVSALPMALLYLKKTTVILPGMHVAFIWIIGTGALFWALLYIVLEQYSYPMDLTWGILVSGSLFLNAVSGSRISGTGLLHGFYQVFMAALCAQLLFLVAAAAWFIYSKRKGDAGLKDISWKYLWLLGAMLSSMGAMAWQFHPPLLRELLGGADISWRALACASFMFQIYFDIRTLKDGSIFRKARGDDTSRNRLHGAWGGMCALGIIASLMGAVAVLLTR